MSPGFDAFYCVVGRCFLCWRMDFASVATLYSQSSLFGVKIELLEMLRYVCYCHTWTPKFSEQATQQQAYRKCRGDGAAECTTVLASILLVNAVLLSGCVGLLPQRQRWLFKVTFLLSSQHTKYSLYLRREWRALYEVLKIFREQMSVDHLGSHFVQQSGT